MNCSGQSDCICGCCAGTNVQTPQVETNPPGLPAVAYRAGTWSSFKESMLARLSSSDYPALAALKTRSDDDFTVAFLDATAAVLDILTFYQERLVNESYLRTAVQLRSLTELSRLIGYQPAPGVSAATYLAFTLKQSPGSIPDPSQPAITIPKGSQVQSVPAQGQAPQTFETSADILAKPDWTALAVQSTVIWMPQMSDSGVFLEGTATQLQPGDLILIVGDERIGLDPLNLNRWDVRVISSVTVDSAKQRTWVDWTEGLGHNSVLPAQQNPKFYAFRQRAALFGYNAIDPHLLDQTHITVTPLNSAGDWNFLSPDLGASALIDLDLAYPKIVPHGWVALILQNNNSQRSPAGDVSLYRVSAVTTISRSEFGLSSKLSRVSVDTTQNLDHLYYANTRQTSALAQSEELEVAEQPLPYPLYGKFVDLDSLRPDLVGATVLALSGKRQKIAVRPGQTGLQFVPDDGSSPANLNPGEVVTLTQPSPLPPPTQDGVFASWALAASPVQLFVEDVNGRTGTIACNLAQFLLVLSDKNDPVVSEYALVAAVNNSPPNSTPHTQFRLKSDLENCYERSTTTVNANVGLATHGQSVTDILGSGNSSTPNQYFPLKQSPLTFTQAPTPTGRQTTLQVSVNSVAWAEVPSLYDHGKSETIFATLNQSDHTTEVLFGDGVEGAVLPTGQNNILANYRIGSGAAGNVGAGTLTTLMDRPPGVSGVTNPQAATGGQDAQSIDDIRSNAPQTVMTLGRVVSITDYQSYASTFAGIAKAYALWIPSGPGRGVFLTVAGINGVALPANNPTLINLASSLKNYGNPLIPITIQTFLETLFTLSADLKYDPAFDPGLVETAVRQALATAFSFAARSFGQSVSKDEICSIIQSVPGIIAVNVTDLKPAETSRAGDLSADAGHLTVTALNEWLSQQVILPRPFSDSASRICAWLPVASAQSLPNPAEILVLHPDPAQVKLGVMP